MELIKINSNNRPYYSDDFIKGFECGAKRQFEADKKARSKGEWKEVPIDDWKGITIVPWYRCTVCGVKSMIASPYCPNCGADMRERKDFQVIVNGNCTKCGKPLSGNRIFICEECEEQNKESE